MRSTRKHTLQFCALLGLSAFALVGVATAQPIAFYTSFEYSGGAPSIGTNAADLNGADGQIGTFSGVFPAGASNSDPGDGIFAGILQHGGPNQFSSILSLDRPQEDGSFFADLAFPVAVDGASVSFEVGTRRSAGSLEVAHEKDYDIIGLDSDGNESFHLRVSAHSGDLAGEVQRLGYLSDSGANLTWDLPTTDGADADGDLDSTGGRFNRGNIALVSLDLEDDGFIVNFAGAFDDNGPTRTYTTDKLAYNGLASELSRIEFTFEGAPDSMADASSFRSGHVLDNIMVTAAIPEPLSGGLAAIAATGIWATPRKRAR